MTTRSRVLAIVLAAIGLVICAVALAALVAVAVAVAVVTATVNRSRRRSHHGTVHPATAPAPVPVDLDSVARRIPAVARRIRWIRYCPAATPDALTAWLDTVPDDVEITSAPVPVDCFTIRQLKEIAQSIRLPRYSRMTKTALYTALLEVSAIPTTA